MSLRPQVAPQRCRKRGSAKTCMRRAALRARKTCETLISEVLEARSEDWATQQSAVGAAKVRSMTPRPRSLHNQLFLCAYPAYACICSDQLQDFDVTRITVMIAALSASFPPWMMGEIMNVTISGEKFSLIFIRDCINLDWNLRIITTISGVNQSIHLCNGSWRQLRTREMMCRLVR